MRFGVSTFWAAVTHTTIYRQFVVVGMQIGKGNRKWNNVKTAPQLGPVGTGERGQARGNGGNGLAN